MKKTFVFLLLFSFLPKSLQADGAVLGDDIAFTMGGDLRTALLYVNDGNADPLQAPGALNWVESRARLRPTMWINEIASFAMTLDLLPDYRFGDTLALPVVRRATLRLITPAGRFSLGRQERYFGLGLRWRTGEDNETLYGFLHDTPVEDRVSWRLARRLAGLPWYADLSAGILQESQTLAAATYGMDDRVHYTVELGLQENRQRAGAMLFSYESQKATSIFIYDLSLYGKWVVDGKVRFAFEGGGRKGSTRQWLVYEPLARTSVQPKIDVEGYRGRMETLLENVQTRSGVSFTGTGLVLQAASGNGYSLGQGRDSSAETAEGVCDCLLAIPLAARVLRDAWLSRALGNIPTEKTDTRASLVRYATEQIGLDGFWSAQVRGALQYRDLLARLTGGFYRSLRSLDTRKKVNNGSTGATYDDIYQRAMTLGFEVDGTVRYRFADSIELGLDAGVLFGGALLDTATGSSDPVVQLMPRLTVSF